jgi:uncharacterized repeat protein (TIGR03803 family)
MRLHVTSLTLFFVVAFTLPANSQDSQVIFRFRPPATSISMPASLMQASDGYLYGTTLWSGVDFSSGAIFKMTPQGVLVNSIVAATGPVAEARNGALYVTGFSSPAGPGVFRLRTNDLELVRAFDPLTEGAPAGGVVEGVDGNLYGVTFDGGPTGLGGIYRLTTAGVLTLLHAFNFDDGSRPLFAMIQAADGSFYGTTTEGGASGVGTLFRITPAGVFTAVHHFSGPTGEGASGLVQGLDGVIYGTTHSGGAHGHGTVFRLTPDGTHSVVYAFTGGADGSSPSGITWTTDGRLCGGAGPKLYCVTPGGQYTLLRTMDPAVEGFSTPQLVHGFDGYFYAVGSNPMTGGTVFRLRNPAPCDSAVALTHRESTLGIRVTLRSESAGYSGAWFVYSAGVIPLWSTAIPVITPAALIDIPVPGISGAGPIGVLTMVVTSGNATCLDWKTIDTGSAAARR